MSPPRAARAAASVSFRDTDTALYFAFMAPSDHSLK
jgi:hypothetical protein